MCAQRSSTDSVHRALYHSTDAAHPMLSADTRVRDTPKTEHSEIENSFARLHRHRHRNRRPHRTIPNDTPNVARVWRVSYSSKFRPQTIRIRPQYRGDQTRWRVSVEGWSLSHSPYRT